MLDTESRIPRESACCAQSEKRPEIAARTARESVPNPPIRVHAPLRVRKTADESALTVALFGAQTP